ncbi:MAG: NAD(+)/NADH kinase [Candidatus Hydrogenedentes bacterium]|nr:NAD(+)/NADH kinase [Candidatus Hydrogenedentota bacterium]
MATRSHAARDAKPVRLSLFGSHADTLKKKLNGFSNLHLVEEKPDVVVCYGGDGTLLAAERAFPGIPKVPVLNSRRGHRCIPHPAGEVLQGLAAGKLVRNNYTKIRAEVMRGEERLLPGDVVALNEFNVHMGLINSAVRFQLWLNGDPYENGLELLGDGFVVCTPFGSTAYFAQITRGIFTTGLGIAFKSTNAHVDHIIVPDDTEFRVRITRGPAVLAYDSADQYVHLVEGDELIVRRHQQAATILTCGPVKRLDEPF